MRGPIVSFLLIYMDNPTYLAERVGLLELRRSCPGRESSIDLDGIVKTQFLEEPD